MGTPTTSKHTEPALVDSQCCVCTGNQDNASSHLAETETRSTKAWWLPWRLFLCVPDICWTYTFQRGLYQGVHNRRNLQSAQRIWSKSPSFAQAFEALLQGLQALLWSHPQSRWKCGLAVGEKDFAYQEVEFFEVRCLCVPFTSRPSSFSPCVKPFDVVGQNWGV